MSHLAQSYRDFIARLEAGHGFWRGRVICNDPAAVRAKIKELKVLAEAYER